MGQAGAVKAIAGAAGRLLLSPHGWIRPLAWLGREGSRWLSSRLCQLTKAQGIRFPLPIPPLSAALRSGHCKELPVLLSSLPGSHPPCTSLGLTRAGAQPWAAPSCLPRRLSPSPPARPCVVRGGGEHNRTSSPPTHLLPPPPSSPPSSPPAPRVLGVPRIHPSPSGTLLLSGCPSRWPPGTRRWGGNSSFRERESKAKGTNANQSQPRAVGSCPGQTHGAGCGRCSSCHCARSPWKALVLEGAKERDFATRSFSSPGIFSSPSPLPPHWLLPCFPGPASTHRCHQTGGLGDSPAPGDVSASPALTLPLDTLLFPFFLRWKGFPPSLPLFPHMGGVAESNGAGSWLHHLEEGALSLREKSWTPSSSFLAPSARRGPCCAVLGYLQAGGALWFSATSLGCCWQGFRSGKSAVRRGP
ncbi:uncharacterized protein LOC141746679 [Larus michahellis]|uniref:uncharacterized protein LOC141746679 n=1 Tax=Larus michahellis TaxID=119627 RepID=UPI003D9B96B7